MIALRMDGVSKVYGRGSEQVTALDDVSLEVSNDELLIMVGPSGSGKTTLLTVAGALLRPTSGSVRVGDIELTELDDGALTRFRGDQIGFVFQSVNLIPFLTASENLLVVRGLGGRKIDAAARRRAARLLDELGLGDRADHLPGKLSGGQQQRVAIGRALMNEPSLLLVDEPTSALDGELGHQVMDLIRSETKRRNIGCVVVTHDERVLGVGDRIVHIVDGHLTVSV